jgi:hypothetical protein
MRTLTVNYLNTLLNANRENHGTCHVVRLQRWHQFQDLIVCVHLRECAHKSLVLRVGQFDFMTARDDDDDDYLFTK